jgi:hypothetical protein
LVLDQICSFRIKLLVFLQELRRLQICLRISRLKQSLKNVHFSKNHNERKRNSLSSASRRTT